MLRKTCKNLQVENCNAKLQSLTFQFCLSKIMFVCLKGVYSLRVMILELILYTNMNDNNYWEVILLETRFDGAF